MNLTIIPKSQIPKEKWDLFVENSDSAWMWHLSDYQEAIATWPGCADRSIAIQLGEKEKEIIGVLPLHLIQEKKFNLYSISTLSSGGGFAFKNNLDQGVLDKGVALALEWVDQLARQEGALEFNASISPLSPRMRSPMGFSLNPLVPWGFESKSSQTYIVPLTQTDEEIIKGFSNLTRRELKKIGVQDHEIRLVQDKGDLESYYRLHCETYRRTGVRPHPRDYFERIFETFLGKGLCRILVLWRGGIPVAAQNTAIYKKAALFWTGASVSEKSGGENRALFHNQIFHAKEIGCDVYETGEGFPGAKGGKVKGLNDFKRSFGGVLVPYHKGRISYGRKRILHYIKGIKEINRNLR